MTLPVTTERCRCWQQYPGVCPHCGEFESGSHFTRCHRAAALLQDAVVREWRWVLYTQLRRWARPARRRRGSPGYRTYV